MENREVGRKFVSIFRRGNVSTPARKEITDLNLRSAKIRKTPRKKLGLQKKDFTFGTKEKKEEKKEKRKNCEFTIACTCSCLADSG